MKKYPFVTGLLFMLSITAGITAQDRHADGATNDTVGRSGFGEWSAPVNLGAYVNSSASDLGAALSPDGNSLYFTSTRLGFGGEDIWVSHRSTTQKKRIWDPPVNLGFFVNSWANDRIRSISADGKLLVFVSDRPGMGGMDIWVSRREDTNDDSGWGRPVNLGPGVNSASNEIGAGYLLGQAAIEDQLYFSSNRPGGLGSGDIYVSNIPAGGSFGAAVNVSQLNSAFNDSCFTLSRDGLEIILSSARPDPNNALDSFDLWVSRRKSVLDDWPSPVNLGPAINTGGSLEAHPALSSDGTTLIFTSDRPGGFGGNDLYMSVRTALK